MKRLTALDLGFIYLEKRNQPLHVAYLNLLKPPADAPADYVQKLVERLRSYAAPLPPFNQRLHSRLGAAHWVEDPEFDIYQHVVHISLPKPGTMAELMSMVSRMHASHLDRAYPLWRTYIIEGIEGGRIATYSKMHHAVADGVAGTRLMLKSMSAKADDILPPTWAMPPRGRRKLPGNPLTAPVTGAARMAAKLGVSFTHVPAIAAELRKSYQAHRAQNSDYLSGLSAPRSILNQNVSASRRFCAQSYSLKRVKLAAKVLGLTVNDAVLAMCSHALRKYLLDLNALPERPLIAAVPMSTRRDSSESGNQIAFMLVNLGTHLSDGAERIRCIKGSVEYSKQRFSKMKPAEILGYGVALMAPGLVNMLANPRAERLPFNLVISNVPGPRSKTYWQGCEVEGLYPVSVVIDGMAMNITLTSREDALDFGIIACRRTLPSVKRMLDYLEQGLIEIEQVADLVQDQAILPTTKAA